MTPSGSDNSGRSGGTRVGLRAPRSPAATPRAGLHRFAARGFRLCVGIRTPGGQVAATLFHALADALADASIAEHRCGLAEQAVLEHRREIEQLCRDLADLRGRLGKAHADYNKLLAEVKAESFEVETTVKPDATLPVRRAP